MTSRRVTYEQLETLWDFLNTHRDIAMGFNKSAQAREMSRRMWTEVAENLNSVVGGANKDWKTWAAYWIDYKGKLKRKCATIRTSHSRTGGGPCETPVLTDIEKKYLSILGEDYGVGLPGIQVDPFHTESTHASTSSAPQDVSPSILLMPEEVMGDNINIGPNLHISSITDPNDQPSTAQQNQPAEPMTAAQSRRQRRRSAPMSQEMARRALVDTSRMRAEATEGILTTLQNIGNVLSRIAATLDSINNRLHVGDPTNEQ